MRVSYSSSVSLVSFTCDICINFQYCPTHARTDSAIMIYNFYTRDYPGFVGGVPGNVYSANSRYYL